MAADARRPGRRRRFDVLVVCTANLCRSPMMEAVLRVELAAQDAHWGIASAGVQARPGMPVHPSVAQVLAERRIRLEPEWRSRRLDADTIERSDLILTATRAHRGAAVALVPAAATRTFTWRQFLRLLAAGAEIDPGADVDPGPDLRSGAGAGPADAAPAGGPDPVHDGDRLIARALAGRGRTVPQNPGDDDVPDPVGSPVGTFRALLDAVDADVRTMGQALHDVRDVGDAAVPPVDLRNAG